MEKFTHVKTTIFFTIKFLAFKFFQPNLKVDANLCGRTVTHKATGIGEGGKTKGKIMLHYSLVFLVIAIIAGVLGFGGIAGTAAGIAKILFFVFLIVWLLAFFMGRKRI